MLNHSVVSTVDCEVWVRSSREWVLVVESKMWLLLNWKVPVLVLKLVLVLVSVIGLIALKLGGWYAYVARSVLSAAVWARLTPMVSEVGEWVLEEKKVSGLLELELKLLKKSNKVGELAANCGCCRGEDC